MPSFADRVLVEIIRQPLFNIVRKNVRFAADVISIVPNGAILFVVVKGARPRIIDYYSIVGAVLRCINDGRAREVERGIVY